MEVALDTPEGASGAVEDLRACLHRQGLSILLASPAPEVAQLLAERLGLPVHRISDLMTVPRPGHLVIVDADLQDAWAARRLNALGRTATLLMPKVANLSNLAVQFDGLVSRHPARRRYG